MKKKIVFTGLLLILGAMGWMAFQSMELIEKKAKIKNDLTEFAHLLSKLKRTDIPANKPTVLILFNSQCEYCQWEMEHIEKNLNQFNQFQLLLTSFEAHNDATRFLGNYGLEEYYLRSAPENVMTALTGAVPQTLIYIDGKLIKHFKGEVKTEAILEALN